MKSMVKLVTRAEKKGGRDNLEASDKVLELLQSWGETFVNHSEKDKVVLFIAYYHELRLKGVRFPHPSTTHSTAVITPKKRASSAASQRASTSKSSTPTAAMNNTLQPLVGLPDEYAIVGSTVEMISQCLDHCTTTEELEANDIVADLMAQMSSVHSKIMSDLEAALLSESPMLGPLMALNDNIHAVLRRREEILTGVGQQQPQQSEHRPGQEQGQGSLQNNGDEEDPETNDSSDDEAGESQVEVPPAPFVVPKLDYVAPRGRTRSSPALKPATTESGIDDLLGLNLSNDPAPQQPPLRQQSDGFGSLLQREDSGWSNFSDNGTATAAASTPTASNSGLGDLAALYQSSTPAAASGGGTMMGGGGIMMGGGSNNMMMGGNNTNNNNMMMGGGGGGYNMTMKQPAMMQPRVLPIITTQQQQISQGRTGIGMAMSTGMGTGMGMIPTQQNQMTGMGMMPAPTQTPPAAHTRREVRSDSNPFDQFNPFDNTPANPTEKEEPAKRRPSNNPFDSL